MKPVDCPRGRQTGQPENASTNVAARPGASRGTVTCQNRCRRRCRASRPRARGSGRSRTGFSSPPSRPWTTQRLAHLRLERRR
jgi:hypothetical protein